MSDFAKQKIAFAIGLLAVLFTLTPLLASYGSLGFALFGARFDFHHLYLALALFLSVAVYCYGMQFVTERPLPYIGAIGDAFYALAIIAPILFCTMFLVAYIVEQATVVLPSPAAWPFIQGALSLIATGSSVLLAAKAKTALTQKERRSNDVRREAAEILTLRRAEELLQSGYSDLAVIEAFKTLEVAGRNIAADKGDNGLKHSSADWYKVLQSAVPADLRRPLDHVRRVRNEAAHNIASVSEAEAREALAIMGKVLALLSGRESDLYSGSADPMEAGNGVDAPTDDDGD